MNFWMTVLNFVKVFFLVYSERGRFLLSHMHMCMRARVWQGNIFKCMTIFSVCAHSLEDSSKSKACPLHVHYRTVVTININKSQAMLTTLMRRGKEHNSALVSIGVIDVNIPQHPVVLHGMMTRSSRRLTSTLQEFRWPLSRTG